MTDFKELDNTDAGNITAKKTGSKKLMYFFITMIFLTFIVYEYIYQYKTRINLIVNSVNSELIQSEYIIKTCSDFVDSIQKNAETVYLLSPKENEFSRLIKSVIETKIPSQQKMFYTLDSFPLPYSKNMIGNIRGTGSLKKRNQQYYREIKMALALNNIFRAAVDSLPNIAWVYYTSKNEFINIYPWEHTNSISNKPEDIYKHITELLTLDFYKFGLPENNPLRKLFWTPAYIDSAGKGMMITCAKPVYNGQFFLGTVSADLTLDVLNKLISDFEIKSGDIFISNNYKQIIAHSKLVKSSDKDIKELKTVIQKNILKQINELYDKNFEGFTKAGDHFVVVRNFKSAPFKLSYIIPYSKIYSSMNYSAIIISVVLYILLLLQIKNSYDKK
ncbi:cache domain-containing protein [Candidatus Dependentiae bacterium]|nr:cache domain-containing protein [Candidatus Dependentiae bacterium]